MGFGVWGLGFGVLGLGFGVWGLGFGVSPSSRMRAAESQRWTLQWWWWCWWCWCLNPLLVVAVVVAKPFTVGVGGCVTFVLRLQCDATAAIVGSIVQCAYIDVDIAMQRL